MGVIRKMGVASICTHAVAIPWLLSVSEVSKYLMLIAILFIVKNPRQVIVRSLS